MEEEATENKHKEGEYILSEERTSNIEEKKIIRKITHKSFISTDACFFKCCRVMTEENSLAGFFFSQ